MFVSSLAIKATGLIEQDFEVIDNSPKAISNLINFRNEFPHSIKVSISGTKDETLSIYFEAYETKSGITLNRFKEYQIRVYDLYDNYLGKLINYDLASDKLIKLSPFYVIQDHFQVGF